MDRPGPRTPDVRVDAAGPEPAAPLTRVEVAVIGTAVAVAVIARFVTTSPLWLDEALSVNIASLPLGDIPDALRQDGHPPLYYLVLHSWMELFGAGDVAVRSLSGVIAVVTLPLAWVAGRRRAGRAGGAAVLLLTAVTPFAVRYATEARMYALASLSVLGAWLLADDLRHRASAWRWCALAVLTGATLLTHYWAFYVAGAAVVVLGFRWWRSGARDEAVRIGSSLAAGAVLFIPWVPSFVDQLTSTGTPWATAGRPASAVVELTTGLGGGSHGEGPVFGWTILVLGALGLFAVAETRRASRLDLTGVVGARGEAAMVVLTFALGIAAGVVTDAVFVARYAAVFVPLLLIVSGVGLARLPAPWPRRVVGAVVLAGAGAGIVVNVIDDRTQGEQAGELIATAGTPEDLVVFCPDQLGPATLRALPPDFEAAAVPTLTRPDRIDWTDYADRNRAIDPAIMGRAILERADGRRIWYVFATSYRTYEGVCDGVAGVLDTARPVNDVVVHPDPDVFEPMTVRRFDP